MLFTDFTWVMSILWFTFGGLLLHILVRKGRFTLHHGVKILLLLVLLFTIRLITPFEIVNAIVVKESHIYPVLQSFGRLPLPWIHHNFTIGYALLFLWAIGAILCLVRLFVQVGKDYKTICRLRQASHPSPDLLTHFHQVIPTRNCYLVISPLVKTPMVAGFFHPTILLPETVVQLSPTTWNHIFQHEYQHIKSKDIWVKLLLKTLCCLLWWNPVTYLLDKNLGQMLELQCDTTVTKSMTKAEKHQYLQSILQVVDTMDNSQKEIAVASCYTGICEEFALRQRFGTVLYSGAPKKIGATILTVVICILFFLSYTVTLQPSGMPTGKEAEDLVILTTENSYIYITEDGEHQLFIYNDFVHILPLDMMKDAPYCDLPIVYES